MKKKTKLEKNIDEICGVMERMHRDIMIAMLHEGDQRLHKNLEKLKKEMLAALDKKPKRRKK